MKTENPYPKESSDVSIDGAQSLLDRMNDEDVLLLNGSTRANRHIAWNEGYAACEQDRMNNLQKDFVNYFESDEIDLVFEFVNFMRHYIYYPHIEGDRWVLPQPEWEEVVYYTKQDLAKEFSKCREMK